MKEPTSAELQRLNPLWKLQRKYKLTASQWHDIVKNQHIKTRHATFTGEQTYFAGEPDPNNSFVSRAIAHGITHEEGALITLENYLRGQGFWGRIIGAPFYVSDQFSMLGASPDGILLDNKGRKLAVVEVKCPQGTNRPKYIKMYKDGKYHLATEHRYYTQCQAQMFCSGVKACLFAAWVVGSRKMYVAFVKYDRVNIKHHVTNLVKLYLKWYIPFLVEKDILEKTLTASTIEKIFYLYTKGKVILKV